MTELITTGRSLETLQAECIQRGHELNGMMRRTVEAAIALGSMLKEVKAKMDHGEFTPWVEANMPVSIKQCQRYMRVHEGLGLLPKGKSTNLLTLDQLDREISHIKRGEPKAKTKVVEAKATTTSDVMVALIMEIWAQMSTEERLEVCEFVLDWHASDPEGELQDTLPKGDAGPTFHRTPKAKAKAKPRTKPGEVTMQRGEDNVIRVFGL